MGLKLFLFASCFSLAFSAQAFLIPDGFSEAVVAPDGVKTIRFFKEFATDPLNGTSDLDFFKQSVTTLALSPGDSLRIELKSLGGEIGVGLNIAAFIQWLGSKGVITTTQVEDHCDSICIPVFAAGQNRLASHNAEFLFHAPRFPGLSGDELSTTLERAEANYLSFLEIADPQLAAAASSEGWLRQGDMILTAPQLHTRFPDFLKLISNPEVQP